MACNCGYTPCQCAQSIGTPYNWYNVDDLPCSPCNTTQVCKTRAKAICTYYAGPSLTGLGLTTNVNIELILTTISLAIQTLNNAITSQGIKNVNILAALNDLNTRVNTANSTSNPPYTI